MAGFSSCIDSAEDQEEFDPRIKTELESLNQSAIDVNRLEKEINESRHKYQETFSLCSQELEQLQKKLGAKVNRARLYYETKELAKEAQSEALLSARKFQSANGVYLAAKETISLAELRLKDDKAACLSPAWQEMLNHALGRVMESEQEKTKSEREHLERAAVFSEMEKKLHILEKKHKRSISKAKPYFDTKSELELRLQQIKQSIEDLQQAMESAKIKYSMSLKNLEAISEGIHEARRQNLILMYPREPGVGAEEDIDMHMKELPNLLDSSNSFHTDDQSDTESEEEEDRDEDFHKQEKVKPLTNDIKNVCHHKEQTVKNHKPFKFVNVKEKPKLKKSVSLPSYATEEELQCEKQTFEIETQSVVLKVESGESVPVSDSTTANSVHRTKTGPQILNPSALCFREPVIGCSSDNL